MASRISVFLSSSEGFDFGSFVSLRMTKDNRKIIAIVGPTASGKTAVGVRLAKEFDGEIVAADSRQVYRGLDLGTGKDLEEYGSVKYHLIDIKNPGEKFTLFDYLPLARAAIEDIFSRGKVPIIVGGTGLYVQALVEGFELESDVIPAKAEILKIPDQVGDDKEEVISNEVRNPAADTVTGSRISRCSDRDKKSGMTQKINSKYTRDQLDELPVKELQEILEELDAEAYKKLSDPKNPHRLIRAIERAQEGTIIYKRRPDWEVLQIGLEVLREELNKRIDKRVDDRFKQGMLEEVELLLKSGVDPEWLLKLGLEYRIIGQFLIGCHSEAKSQRISEILWSLKLPQDDKIVSAYNDMKDELKLRSHQYAKRQMTWFKRFSEIKWLKDYQKIREEVEIFLSNSQINQ